MTTRSPPKPADFPSHVTERVRYSDTDRQGHVNNLQFGAFLEAGRAQVLHADEDLSAPSCFFVIARTSIEFRGEIHWPGEVLVCTRVERLGNSSATFSQALFQNGGCAAVAESVMVQIDIASRTAAPLSDAARSVLAGLAGGTGAGG